MDVRRPLLVLLLLVAGCTNTSSGGGGTAATTTTGSVPAIATTVAQVPATTLAPGVAPPFQMPAVVDVAYVQRLLDAVYRLDGEATRRAFVTGAPDAEVDERLLAIFGDPALAEARQVLADQAADGFARLANPPGDATVRVLEVLEASRACIVVRADLDRGPVFREPRPAPARLVIRMARADALAFNPTGWGVVSAGVPEPDQDVNLCR